MNKQNLIFFSLASTVDKFFLFFFQVTYFWILNNHVKNEKNYVRNERIEEKKVEPT